MTESPSDTWTVAQMYQLEATLARLLRAHRSQEQVNRKLGFNGFNGIAKIEQGRRRLLWSEFVRLCTLAGRDLVAILREAGIPLREVRNSFANEGKLVELLTSGYPTRAFHRVQGWPHSKINRLRAGQIPLKLVDILAVLARNDGPLALFIERIGGGPSALKLLGLHHLHSKAIEGLTDPWIGLFYSLLELKTIHGNPQTKASVQTAFCGISQMNSTEFVSWLEWMKEQGLIQETRTHFSPGLRQGSFSAPTSTLKSLHACVEHQLTLNRARTLEARQPGAFAFQFLAANPSVLKAMGKELKALRQKLHELSREALRKGEADTLVIAETVLIAPEPSSSEG